MAIIAIILSSLALLAATGNAILTLRERKHSQERNAAQMQYADSVGREAVEKAASAAEERISNFIDNTMQRLDDLEKGVVPDFEKAKAAANAVNDFSSGITGILGYDPFDALKAARAKENGGAGE